jgi:hypothetical protein
MSGIYDNPCKGSIYQVWPFKLFLYMIMHRIERTVAASVEWGEQINKLTSRRILLPFLLATS